MKNKLTDQETSGTLSLLAELVLRLYNKSEVLTRHELDLLDKLEEIKEKLK